LCTAYKYRHSTSACGTHFVAVAAAFSRAIVSTVYEKLKPSAAVPTVATDTDCDLYHWEVIH
jgi:hypothetical protein